MGDYVLVMVKGTDDMPCYVPGQVELTPKQSPQGNGKFYEVTVYNGSRVSSLRSSIVKIGKARYNFSVAYIKERFVHWTPLKHLFREMLEYILEITAIF